MALPPYPLATEVLTWEELLDVWEAAVADLPPSPDSVAADIVQLRALCLTLGGLVIEPLGEAAAGAEWREKESELRVLVDAATKRLKGTNRLPPIDDEGVYLARRYFLTSVLGANGERAWGAIGIRSDIADAGGPPAWVRFHKVTPGFRRVLDVLMASSWRESARRDDNHLWLPLTIDPTLSGPAVVASLVHQVRGVEQVLLDSGAFSRLSHQLEPVEIGDRFD